MDGKFWDTRVFGLSISKEFSVILKTLVAKDLSTFALKVWFYFNDMEELLQTFHWNVPLVAVGFLFTAI